MTRSVYRSEHGRQAIAQSYVNTLRRAASAVPLRRRIVGMSLGGWIGLHFATRFPGRVGALSLLAASGLARQRRSFLFIALPLAMLGDWG